VVINFRLGDFFSRLQAGVAEAMMLFVSQLLIHRGRWLTAVRVAFPALRRLYLLLRNDGRQAVCRALRRLRAGGAADVNRVARGKRLLYGLIELF
jgi:hypothetical protein